MKSDNSVVALVIFFIFGFYLGPLLENSSLGLGVSDFAGAIATLIAAYVGAHSAFYLSQKKKNEDLKNKNIDNANKFLINLYFAVNDLLLIDKNWVASSKNMSPAHRHIFMQATQNHDIDKYDLDLKYIDFLYTPSHMHFILNAGLEIESYKLILKTINARSELKINEVDKILSEKRLIHGVEYQPDLLILLIGQSRSEQLKSLTDSSIELLHETIPSMIKLKDSLRAVFEEIYPDAKFIDFEVPDKY